MTAKEHYKKRYKLNRAKKIAASRLWAKSNPEKRKMHTKTWNDKNKEYYCQWYLDKGVLSGR